MLQAIILIIINSIILSVKHNTKELARISQTAQRKIHVAIHTWNWNRIKCNTVTKQHSRIHNSWAKFNSSMHYGTPLRLCHSWLCGRKAPSCWKYWEGQGLYYTCLCHCEPDKLTVTTSWMLKTHDLCIKLEILFLEPDEPECPQNVRACVCVCVL